jgi:hypothetical protein
MFHLLVSLAVQAGLPAIDPATFSYLVAAFAALGLSTEMRRRAARNESSDAECPLRVRTRVRSGLRSSLY